MAARVLPSLFGDSVPARRLPALAFAPPAGVVDRAAWARFCALVADGGGVDDRAESPAAGLPRPSPIFFRDEVMRVEHHRRNTLPFLLEACALGGHRVLEFGAGTAGLSIAMARGGVRHVTGVEPNPTNCETGRWRVHAYGMEDAIELRHVPDTSRLPFAAGAFEAVVCSSVLQYVPQPARRRALLAEMMRVLAPGGLLVVCNSGNGLIPGGPHSTRWWSNLAPERAARRGHPKRGVTWWELRRALASLGAGLVPGKGALERWRTRVSVAGGRPRWTRRALLAGYGLLEAAVCPRAGVPVEALLPYPELAFRKTGALAPGRSGRT
jgi:ubiquinone/menaquinone biosynthesis C-methylase UbiE